MNQNINVVIKTITGALDTNIRTTEEAVLTSMPLIGAIMNRVDFASGRTLYPFTDVPAAGATAIVVNGMPIPKIKGIKVMNMTDETLEDANPKVDIGTVLSTSMGQVIAKDVESALITSVRTSVLPPAPVGATPNWAGIVAVLQQLGPSIYNTKGVFHVGVSLTQYFAIVGDSVFTDAMRTQELKDKIKIVPSEHLADTEMFIFHTHGIAGGYQQLNLEFDREGGQNQTAYVGAYNWGYFADPKYLRFVK